MTEKRASRREERLKSEGTFIREVRGHRDIEKVGGVRNRKDDERRQTEA